MNLSAALHHPEASDNLQRQFYPNTARYKVPKKVLYNKCNCTSFYHHASNLYYSNQYYWWTNVVYFSCSYYAEGWAQVYTSSEVDTEQESQSGREVRKQKVVKSVVNPNHVLY